MDRRLKKVKVLIDKEGLDGVLVTGSVNRRYLSGFTGTAGYLLITSKDSFIITDFRYTQQAENQCRGFKVIECGRNLWDRLNSLLKEYDIKNLGFEDGTVTYRQYRRMEEKFEGVNLVPLVQKMNQIRIIKDKEELESIRTATEISERALEHVKPLIKPGTAEKDISMELEFFMRRSGCSGPAFDFIVASGHRSALPHGVASDKKIRYGDLVTIDFGGIYNGYCSDMTRTFMVGKKNSKQREIYDTVLAAQTEALNGIRAGITGSMADGLARDIIDRAGYGEHFGHGLGHGVGLDIHEEPTLSRTSDTVLQPGMVVSVEPGIYISGFAGVRIEDLVVVTSKGIDNLNRSAKELIVL